MPIGETELQLPTRGGDLHARAAHAVELDLRSGDVGRRTVGVAVRAGVVAQVSDESPLV
jgi:hypothetical protein